MNTFAKVAIAAVAVLAIGAVGLAVLRPGQAPGSGGSPPPSPTPFDSPALTQTFTSVMHGISASYPAGWKDRPATGPWTDGIPTFDAGFGDFVYDDSTEDLKFIGLASHKLAGKFPNTWVTEISTDPAWGTDCAPHTEPTTVDRASGLLVTFCPGGVLAAVIATADRGYLVTLYGVGKRAWFEEVLETVKLHPKRA